MRQRCVRGMQSDAMHVGRYGHPVISEQHPPAPLVFTAACDSLSVTVYLYSIHKCMPAEASVIIYVIFLYFLFPPSSVFSGGCKLSHLFSFF